MSIYVGSSKGEELTEILPLNSRRYLLHRWNTDSLLGQGDQLSPANSEKLLKLSYSRLAVDSNRQKKQNNTVTVVLQYQLPM